jgi:hypothetical protein
VLNDAGGRELLLEKYGLRKVPVVAKGDKYVFGQNIENVAEFVGLEGTGLVSLPPAQLYEKYRKVFEAAQRFAVQFPPERFNEPVIPNRDRLIRTLNFHIFRIGEAFLETWNGAEFTTTIASNPPDDSMQTGNQIAAYGAGVWKKIEAWWTGVEDPKLARTFKTFYGEISGHRLFERSTWHSAQHCRQLVAALERMGIQANGALTAEDLAGLPLPERLWE